MSQEKKERKFNIVDLFVIIVLVAVVALVAWKFIGSKASSMIDQNKYTVVFTQDEVSSKVANQIKVGDRVSLNDDGSLIGTVTNVLVNEESISYANNAQGKWVQSSKPGYSSINVEVEVEGSLADNGIKVSGMDYFVGQTLTIRVGMTRVYPFISSIIEVK